MKLTFFGAVGEVTGSRYLVENQEMRILVDCGLFQGPEEINKHNRDRFPIEPITIDAIILTHAHIDHSGYISVLVRNGFGGKIYCSKATYALCSIVLIDSGSLFEKEAEKSEPLYTKNDAEHSLKSFQVVDYNKNFCIGKSLKCKLIQSNHIQGSSFVIISDEKNTLTFSGDLGRPNQLIMKAPPHLKYTDFLVIESTYGDRLHKKDDPIKTLGEIINDTINKNGVVIIPAFSIGRTQTILYCLYILRQQKIIPDIPIFLDSPMSIDATNLFCKFKNEYKLSPDLCKDIFDIATFTNSVKESKKIDHTNQSKIIIAGSGMAEGGRVLHHFKHYIHDAKNTVVFVGFQAEGTTGRSLIEGAKKIKVDNKRLNVNADIKRIESFSAHADYNEILDWLKNFENDIKKVFITHGEKKAALSLKNKIEKQFHWPTIIPKYSESFELN